MHDARLTSLADDLRTYLPRAGEATLVEAAQQWVFWFGLSQGPEDVSRGLLRDFLQRYGGGDDEHALL